MAKPRKTDPSPGQSIEVAAPRALIPLIQAFHVNSDKVAKGLIQEAARAIYCTHDTLGRPSEVSKHELDAVLSLMKGIDPRDTLETLYAAQIVVGHLLGMRKLSNEFSGEQKLGLDLLRFSNEAMAALTRKRCGGQQNITVNYLQADVQTKRVINAGQRS